MRFAVSLPWWGYGLLFVAAAAIAWLTYARAALRLSRRRRVALTGLRALTLAALVAILLRPVVELPSEPARDQTVVLLVDDSRSMRLADAGVPRTERARQAAAAIAASLGERYRIETHGFGEALTRTGLDRLTAAGRRSDLGGALMAAAEQYRDRRVAAYVLLSDGGDTEERQWTPSRVGSPVFTIGVGARDGIRDREVLAVSAGEPVLANASVDLSVSAVAHGFATQPIELRLSANGRPLEVRRVVPTVDDAPVHEVFTVSPDRDNPTVYTVEIPSDPGELAAENNVRSVLVPPQGRRRRVLVVEGAPGFEHTFLKRALAEDPGLEVDSVVRKGQNDEGRDTFFVQATASRAEALAAGYPATRAALFAYDAVIVGNVEGDFFTRDQLSLTAALVAERGGGLLVLGARSFERGGLLNTPLEEALPVDLSDRGPAVARTSGSRQKPFTLELTEDGALHPATRLSVGVDDSRQRWSDLPPLASSVEIGQPRPGAQVLAVTYDADGATRPVLAAQRFGYGRSMVFAGEAAWRWRMQLPATDTTYQTLWRQLARWLTAGAREPIAILPVSVPLPGRTDEVSVAVRDEQFRGIADADVRLQLTAPDGEQQSWTPSLADADEGRYAVPIRFEQPGLYRLSADVRRAGRLLATVQRPVLVGGADLEMSEPHLNEAVLRRLAESGGGRYAPVDNAAQVAEWIEQGVDTARPPEVRDAWHTGWLLLLVIGLLSAEWVIRRQAGFA